MEQARSLPDAAEGVTLLIAMRRALSDAGHRGSGR